MYRVEMSVLGKVMCRSYHGKCVEGDIYRLDPDLEFCICRNCDQGWVRDVDAWTKLEESFERLNKQNKRLDAAINSLKASLGNMNSVLAKAAKDSGL